MRPSLDPNEARVLGSLVEKAITTPDYYPLSLNALTSACNQKSNREPVLSLRETEVQTAIDSLMAKTLARRDSSAGGRVERYAHRIDDRLFGELQFAADELAIVCLLLLRGPQTAGELRSRSNRLFAFDNLGAVEQTLERLRQREDGPYVTTLPREPGRREIRYAHLFGTEGADEASNSEWSDALPSHAAPDRIAVATPGSASDMDAKQDAPENLDARVQALEAKVEELCAMVDELIDKAD